jgi:hypothetical protein
MHLYLFHPETRLPHTPCKSTVRTCRPYCQNSSVPQRLKRGLQPGPGIEPFISLPGQSIGAVVHIKQYSIIGKALVL